MRIDILTLFPEMFAPLKESVIGRAVRAGKLEINIIDIRAFSLDKHKKCDDYPFGGGAGMVMTPQPAVAAIEAADGSHAAKRIYLSPKGAVFTQERARRLAEEKHILLFCGHFEGVDQRIIDGWIDEEISAGDYVLTGGEIPALLIADAVARLIPGVLGNETSTEEESFSAGLLEFPQYTRPQEFMGREVPDVLVSGNHALVAQWRKAESEKITAARRPDMYAAYRAEQEKLPKSPLSKRAAKKAAEAARLKAEGENGEAKA